MSPSAQGARRRLVSQGNLTSGVGKKSVLGDVDELEDEHNVEEDSLGLGATPGGERLDTKSSVGPSQFGG